MSKLILKETGKEVKMGDKLIQVATMFGISIPVGEITVTKKLFLALSSKV